MLEPSKPKSSGILFGGYGGLSIFGTGVSRRPAIFTGLQGGLVIGRFSVGLGARSLAHRWGDIIGTRGEDLSLAIQYFGAHVAVSAFRRTRWQIDIGSLLAVGNACLHEKYSRSGCLDRVRLFAAEPEAVLYVLPTSWMRLGLVGGGRVIVRERWLDPYNFRLSGLYAGAKIEFGWFGHDDQRER
jgi:hypothetical protein